MAKKQECGMPGLANFCDHCEGSGKKLHDQWRRWLNQEKETPPPEVPKYMTCTGCNGLGFDLTTSGIAFMRFLEALYPGLAALRVPLLLEKPSEKAG